MLQISLRGEHCATGHIRPGEALVTGPFIHLPVIFFTHGATASTARTNVADLCSSYTNFA
ncbi:Uncharacterised protein [Mycobacteroides abscessus subsp. abscessus]|nr:Uncharacterised protein [Mycobacteroides abscessus subsp. abscessus]